MTLWECAFTPVCALNGFAAEATTSALAAAHEHLCNQEEALIRLASVVTSMLSPAFAIMYELSTIPVVRHTDEWQPDASAVAAAHFDCAGAAAQTGGICNANEISQKLCATVYAPSGAPRCVDWCSTKSTQTDCLAAAAGGPAACAWLASGACVRADDAWMAYQSHPLEASLITMFVSLANTVTFYPMHVVVNTLHTLLGVFTLNDPLPASQHSAVTNLIWANTTALPPAPPAPHAPPFGSTQKPPPPWAPAPGAPAGSYSAEQQAKRAAEVAALDQAAAAFARAALAKAPAGVAALDRVALQSMPRTLATRVMKNTLLPARDVLFGFYELVRSAVFVGNPADLATPGFVAFSNTLRDTFNLCELVSQTITEALIDIIQTGMRIVADAVLVLIDPPRIVHHLNDIIKAIKALLLEAIHVFEQNLPQFLFQLPGGNVICAVIIEPVVVAVNGLLSVACGIVNAVNVLFDGALPTDAVCDLHLPDVCSAKYATVTPQFTFEASTCVRDADCGATASCAVDSSNTSCSWSGWNAAQLEVQYQYVQPCPCGQLAATPGREPFCNVATGFCEEGPSFLGPPLRACPAAGGLAFEQLEFAHALCYTMPTWRCGAAARAAFLHDDPVAAVPYVTRTGDPAADLQACRFALANATWADGTPRYLQGPYLCADACAPSALNAGNRLTLVTRGDASACVCEVGIQARAIRENAYARPPL